MAELQISEGQAILIGACVTAATAIGVARHWHEAGELEKLIAERAFQIYEAVVSRFELPQRD